MIPRQSSSSPDGLKSVRDDDTTRDSFFENQADQASDNLEKFRVGRPRKYPVPKCARPKPAQEPEDGHPQWLDTKAAARYLSTTEGGIRNRVYRGQLTRYYLGRSLRFKRSELDRLLETSIKGGFDGS